MLYDYRKALLTLTHDENKYSKILKLIEDKNYNSGN